MATELERCHGSWKRCPAGVQQEPGCQAKEKVQGGRAQGINSLSLLWGEEVLALGEFLGSPSFSWDLCAHLLTGYMDGSPCHAVLGTGSWC